MTKVYFYTLRLVVSTGQQYQHNFTLICLVKKRKKRICRSHVGIFYVCICDLYLTYCDAPVVMF